MCLYDMKAKYRHEPTKPLPKNVSDKIVQLSPRHGYLVRLDRPHLVKYYVASQKTALGREQFYHDKLQLFKPWRDEEHGLIGKQIFV
jgi:hypothetical protein